jgi:hypothetical protein
MLCYQLKPARPKKFRAEMSTRDASNLLQEKPCQSAKVYVELLVIREAANPGRLFSGVFMGTFLSFDDLNQVLFIRFEGIVNDEVLLSRYQQVREWLAAYGYCSNISDFSAVASFDVTTDGVSQLASNAPLVPDNYLRVVVAPQDEVFGMTRMFEILGSSTRNKVHIVRDVSTAYRLVGIEEPQFRPILEW